MAAHGATSTPITFTTDRVRPPRPRVILALVVLLVVTLVATFPQQVADTAHAACTIGTAADTTCGEALVLLGYP